MIDLYAWSTPNGFKPIVMLEETGLPWRLRRVDLSTGAQKSPDFLALNPNGKIPAMVDDDGQGGRIQLFESGAILLYLAERSGRLMPSDARGRFAVVEWLMFQMAGVGPMFGQLGSFRRADPPNPAAVEKFSKECERLLNVLESRLSQAEWLAEDYSIADISTFTWIRAADFVGLDLSGAPGVMAWRDRIAARPAVARAYAAFDGPDGPEGA